jgi:hypothetical protein
MAVARYAIPAFVIRGCQNVTNNIFNEKMTFLQIGDDRQTMKIKITELKV